MAETLYWYDYETFGIDPQRDRIAQVGGLRTTTDLDIIGDPLSLYCRPPTDYVPHAEACLVTGITPQQALSEGVSEAQFAARLLQEFSREQTCSVGYNSIRFDEEFTRFLLYRNLRDPYAREWRNGNTRWDLIDMLRLAHALRPEGIHWPKRDDGATSFRLEELAAANDLAHQKAHDALSDVHATLALARLVRERQRRLFDFVFEHRTKNRVARLLQLDELQPVLHVSARYPAERGCIAMVLALSPHPSNRNGVIVYDLRQDPAVLLEQSGEQIRQQLFAPASDNPVAPERPALKMLHLNRAPVIAPVTTLTGVAAEKWGIDVALAERHSQLLRENIGSLRAKMADVYGGWEQPAGGDPEHALYGGGFVGDDDRRVLDRMDLDQPASLRSLTAELEDPRLSELLFRYRARNFADTLDEQERKRWYEQRCHRLTSGDDGLHTLDELERSLDGLMQNTQPGERNREVLDELRRYGEQLRTGTV